VQSGTASANIGLQFCLQKCFEETALDRFSFCSFQALVFEEFDGEVVLSYSRHDVQLQQALADAGEETRVDWSGIPTDS
jgi:hypothetical protein